MSKGLDQILGELAKHKASEPFLLDIEYFYAFKIELEVDRNQVISEKDGKFNLTCWGRNYVIQIKPRKTVLNRLKRWWVYLTT